MHVLGTVIKESVSLMWVVHAAERGGGALSFTVCISAVVLVRTAFRVCAVGFRASSFCFIACPTRIGGTISYITVPVIIFLIDFSNVVNSSVHEYIKVEELLSYFVFT